MKRALLLVGIIGLVAGFAASAAPLGLCNYVSQQSDIRHLSLSLSYRYFDDLETTGVDVNGGRAGLDFNQVYDSPDIGFSLAGYGEVTLANSVLTTWLAESSGTFRYYVMQDAPFFGFGGVDATLASGQPQPGVHVSAGVGYGRFTNVTPLAKAFKIGGDLLSSNAIPSRLSDSTLMGIAKIIGTKYTSTKDQIADIVSQIQAATSVTLDARQVLKIEDIVLATGDERDCGWAVQAGFGYKLIDPSGAGQDFLITASADAAFAPDPAGQFLFRATFSGPFDIVNENALALRASYDYALSATSSLRATYALQRVQPLGDPATMSHAAALTLGFVLGRADMGLQVSFSKAADHPAWTIDISLSAAMSLL